MSLYPPGGLWVNSGPECEEIVGDIGARGQVNWGSDLEIILCDGWVLLEAMQSGVWN